VCFFLVLMCAFPSCTQTCSLCLLSLRDTDEISYQEVGVPAGRIFIINPKVPCPCLPARLAAWLPAEGHLLPSSAAACAFAIFGLIRSCCADIR
jgi:hypothetical protein